MFHAFRYCTILDWSMPSWGNGKMLKKTFLQLSTSAQKPNSATLTRLSNPFWSVSPLDFIEKCDLCCDMTHVMVTTCAMLCKHEEDIASLAQIRHCGSFMWAARVTKKRSHDNEMHSHRNHRMLFSNV